MQLVGDHFLIKTDIKNMNKTCRKCWYNTLTNALTVLSKHSKDASTTTEINKQEDEERTRQGHSHSSLGTR